MPAPRPSLFDANEPGSFADARARPIDMVTTAPVGGPARRYCGALCHAISEADLDFATALFDVATRSELFLVCPVDRDMSLSLSLPITYEDTKTLESFPRVDGVGARSSYVAP